MTTQAHLRSPWAGRLTEERISATRPARCLNAVSASLLRAADQELMSGIRVSAANWRAVNYRMQHNRRQPYCRGSHYWRARFPARHSFLALTAVSAALPPDSPLEAQPAGRDRALRARPAQRPGRCASRYSRTKIAITAP